MDTGEFTPTLDLQHDAFAKDAVDNPLAGVESAEVTENLAIIHPTRRRRTRTGPQSATAYPSRSNLSRSLGLRCEHSAVQAVCDLRLRR